MLPRDPPTPTPLPSILSQWAKSMPICPLASPSLSYHSFLSFVLSVYLSVLLFIPPAPILISLSLYISASCNRPPPSFSSNLSLSLSFFILLSRYGAFQWQTPMFWFMCERVEYTITYNINHFSTLLLSFTSQLKRSDNLNHFNIKRKL